MNSFDTNIEIKPFKMEKKEKKMSKKSDASHFRDLNIHIQVT